MRTRPKWLQSATMMAFLAVVALFVSPALALGCCCQEAAPIVHSVPAPGAHCHDEAAAESSHHAETGARCVSVRDNCDCDSVLANAMFVTSDQARFFAPVAVVLPAQTPLLTFIADARRAQYAHFAARPRLPDRTQSSGRAPPALALS